MTSVETVTENSKFNSVISATGKSFLIAYLNSVHWRLRDIRKISIYMYIYSQLTSLLVSIRGFPNKNRS